MLTSRPPLLSVGARLASLQLHVPTSCTSTNIEPLLAPGLPRLTSPHLAVSPHCTSPHLPSGPQVDWRDRRHWRCNNNVHPSRHGTYDGITMHPFETIFLKASWHVGEPFVEKYSNWVLAQVGRGRDSAEGVWACGHRLSWAGRQGGKGEAGWLWGWLMDWIPLVEAAAWNVVSANSAAKLHRWAPSTLGCCPASCAALVSALVSVPFCAMPLMC